MFILEVGCQPNYGNRLQSGRVSQKLAQMIMVGALQLVLD